MPERHKFQRLGRYYLLALSGIAGIIIISQLFVQQYISRQQNDSRIVNIAGRQRMLSQNISKTALKIKLARDHDDLTTYLNQLKEMHALWVSSHDNLRNDDSALKKNGGNSKTINAMFDGLQSDFDSISINTEHLLRGAASIDSLSEITSLDPFISNILDHEGPYLAKMNEIVFQYDDEAKEKVSSLKRIELILLSISLSIIFIELIFIFRPLATNIRKTISNLIKSEEASKKMTQEINKLYNELGNSYQELEAVNQEPDQPTIFLKTNDIGKITYISERFRRIMGYEGPNDVPDNLIQLLETNYYNPDFIKNLMSLITSGKTWVGELKFTSDMGDFVWLDINIVPTSKPKEQKVELMVIGRDMTKIKEAKQRSREINREKIEKRVKEQEYRSVLILEGQEEERKRISREIHDGIGQMLTAMKLNMEAITPSSSVHSRKRFDDTKSLLKNVIKEVRRVSFNLTPSSLSDFGIAPAIKKFCSEVEKLSDINIIFENKTGFINRLEKNIETNIYRIIQEAVNNAVKYSRAEHIFVTLAHNSTHLEIEIADDGIGFDYDKLNQSGHFGVSGHGVFNMKERAAFINGKFKIESAEGKGTKIKATIPIV